MKLATAKTGIRMSEGKDLSDLFDLVRLSFERSIAVHPLHHELCQNS